jgi:hypothetical protein
VKCLLLSSKRSVRERLRLQPQRGERRYRSRPSLVAKCSELTRIVCGGVAGGRNRACPCVAFSPKCFCYEYSENVSANLCTYFDVGSCRWIWLFLLCFHFCRTSSSSSSSLPPPPLPSPPSPLSHCWPYAPSWTWTLWPPILRIWPSVLTHSRRFVVRVCLVTVVRTSSTVRSCAEWGLWSPIPVTNLVYPTSSGSSPLTSPAWEALPVATDAPHSSTCYYEQKNNGRSLGTFQNAVIFGKSGSVG